jgi:hypothetical protein
MISYTVRLYFRFPLSLRMVEAMLAARSIDLTDETVRRWALKFDQQISRNIRNWAGIANDCFGKIGSISLCMANGRYRRIALVAVCDLLPPKRA